MSFAAGGQGGTARTGGPALTVTSSRRSVSHQLSAAATMDPGALERVKTALIDRYRFDCEIGRGGGGCVWRALDIARGRPVAIKCMVVGTSLLARRDRYLLEIQIEANLAHPNIVPLFDSGEVDDVVYLVMPLVDGGSLQARLAREGSLPVREALRVGKEVVQGLLHAHSRDVVHRDIKPGNILFLSGHAQIADFGIARILQAESKDMPRTTDMVPFGTPVYMSPEQANGSTGVDGRSDLYSLGCVLYEMLVGHPPFEGRTHSEVLLRHAVDPVPPIRSVRQTVAPAIEAMVMRALAKVPADRFANAEEMLRAIDEAMLADPGSGPTPVPVPVPVPVLVPRPIPWSRLAAVAVGVLVLSAGTRFVAAQREMARLVSDADTTRLVAFPFETDQASGAADERLRRSLAHWRGIKTVETFALRERIGTAPITTERANDIALRLHAGRFVRGTIATTGTGLEVRLVLFDAGRSPRSLHEEVVKVSLDDRALDSSFAAMVEGVLLREPLPPDVHTAKLSTRSLPAVQAYLRGRAAVTRWDLESAVAEFERAWAIDRTFGSAGLWVALTKYWNEAAPTEWTYAAYAALRDSLLMTTREAGAARAMVATNMDDVTTACAEWDALTERDPFDFKGWYGSALCRDRDRLVRPDPRSRSGWAYRSSYHTALTRYLRAYALMLPMHRALGARSFERVRDQLHVLAQYSRPGIAADGASFYGAPHLVADTLVFVPFPEMAVMMAAPATITDQHEDQRIEKRQRELFRSLASMWASGARASPEAREALAVALQLLGDPTALDTMRSAMTLEGEGPRRFRFASTLAWMGVAFGLPDDWSALTRAGATTDSVLASDTSAANAEMRAGLAALFGRSAYVVRTTTAGSARVDRTLSAPIVDAMRTLTVLAAMGHSSQRIAEHERRVDSLITALVPRADRDAVRGDAFGRAARLAWSSAPLSVASMSTVRKDYLVPMLVASTRGDMEALRPMLQTLRAMRRSHPPANVSFDALLPEAALLARHGDPALAAAWLDEAFGTVRTSTPNFDAIRAAALVRCLVLRAELAVQLGQPAEAKRWAGAVVALWEKADPDLQPVVARMRVLAR